MAEKRDYYEVLGVGRDASPEEIKRVFREQVKKWHPDRHQGDKKKEAEERFKEIAEAYSILSDKEKRRQYDRFGHAAAGGPGGVDFSGVSVEDILQSFFGGGGGGSIFDEFFGNASGSRTGGMRQGAGLRYDMEISLEEAVKGVEKTIKFEREELCPKCDGSGAKPGTHRQACSSCGGRGFAVRGHGFFTMRTACPVCRGEGTVVKTPCPSCRGSGRKRKQITLEAPIPAGIEDNTRIRLAGQGEPGDGGGPRGDLFLIVHVREHEYFERHGRDLWLEVPIPFSMAALGGEIEVPTITGRSRLKIPRGTPSGQVLRLRGLGAPDMHGYGRGDQLVRVVVRVPTKLSREQEELLRRLAALDRSKVEPRKRSFFHKVRDFFSDE